MKVLLGILKYTEMLRKFKVRSKFILVSCQGKLKSIHELGFERRVGLKLFKSKHSKSTEAEIKRAFWR